VEHGTREEREMQQLAARAKELGEEREERVKAAARQIDRKTFAAACDISYSYASDILNTNGKVTAKPWQEWMTGVLILLNPEGYMAEVAAFDAEHCGYDKPLKKRKLTPEEENKVVKERIKLHGLGPLFKDLFPDLSKV
jgi:formate-dependent nitrite reductase cytochrome c552 subunit